MKRRIQSNYPYATKYEGGLLELRPGINLIEEANWAKTQGKSDRLCAQLTTGKVVDHGRYIAWFIDQLLDPETGMPNVNTLSQEEALELVASVKDRQVLEALHQTAERGGVRSILKEALAGQGG